MSRIHRSASRSPPRAAADARRVWNLGRPQLLALEVGNEPDLFVMQHLRNYWDPRMRREILAHLAAGGEGLEPVSRAALERLV